MDKNMAPNPNEGGEQQNSEPNALAAEANNFDADAAREAIEQRKAEMADGVAEGDTNANEATGEGIYSREYREQVNAPVSDLFTKRKVLIEEQFPALKPLSQEEWQRYAEDRDYQDEVKRARDEVPADVVEEHDLLWRMVSRLDDGANADLTPDHPWASSEPNYIPVEIEEDGYGSMVLTKWKAEQSKEALARMKELHEKNSEIIDFSHEQEVDIDSMPEDLQKTIDSIGEELAELNSANIRDFHPSGDDRPKTAAVYDKIFGLAKEKNLSFAARKELTRKKHEFEKMYVEARDAAELRSIDAEIAALQKEKAEVEERQKKYANAGFVSRLFNRVFNPRREEKDQNRASDIDNRMEKLRSMANSMRGEGQE